VKDESAETFLEIGDVAFDGFIPMLTPASLWEPTGVCTEVDELLVDGLIQFQLPLAEINKYSKSSSRKTAKASPVFPPNSPITSTGIFPASVAATA